MGWRKLAESFNLTKSDITVPELKRFKTENKVELPNNAEFTGDKLPSEGDSAQAELKAWKEGDKLFKKDTKQEDKDTSHGSPLTSEKVKRDDVDDHAKKNDLYSSLMGGKLGWYERLSSMQMDRKPDGTIKLLIDDSPQQPEPQVQQEEEVPQSQVKASKVESWIIKEAGNLQLIGKECTTHCGIAILQNGVEQEFHKFAKNGHLWEELINQGLWESKFDSLVKNK